MKFTTRYDYEPPKGKVFKKPSKTYQEGKDDCDINILHRRYLSKGFTPPNVVQLEARYADMTNVQSFEEMLNIQNDVEQLFNELPSELREACQYKVDNFVKIISEPSNQADVQAFQYEVFDKLGMLERKQQFQEVQKQAETPAPVVEAEPKAETST